MKHISLLLFALFCYTSPLLAQDFWEQLNFPDSTTIFSIAVNNQGDIFCGTGKNGGTGGVYRSLDTGVTWECMGMSDKTIYSVAINNNGDIYAGANQSVYHSGLYRSIDNGLNWEPISSDIGTDGNVIAILPLGDTIFASIWAESGAVIRSTDNGQTWERVFTGIYSNEYVTDIVISGNGNLFISLMGFSENRGGVYKSVDGGNSWNFIGLFNCMVRSLAVNSSNDLFAGLWYGIEPYSSGVYGLRNGAQDWEELIIGPQISGIIVNSDDHIYCTSSWPNGIIRSLDNGITFELFKEGLPIGPMGYMTIDDDGYLYLTSEASSNYLAKTIDTTVGINESNDKIDNSHLLIYPNPTDNVLNIEVFPNNELPVGYKINIYNNFGKLLSTNDKTISIDQIYIDVSGFNAGFYIVEIINSNFKRTFPFIKK